ncbi:hypothetical protein K1T71_008327 [Dendrolimus kikuchii]|uniref:Uncharacterized protein n=1 Tax=Dendrolimus kikuchii TaxID=765133 RepID=A0ACC1CWX5_9NEOP|nr:hypothetical protein K1T71_008327 [Dendrolimus kikuchii]
MIINKIRETRKVKAMKLSKNIERLYKEGKCRECAVVVTRMDFAKILGKFTKVKIQYESSSTRKDRLSSPHGKSRFKSNENGVVHIQKQAGNEKPTKNYINSKTSKLNENVNRSPNILKENNRLKKTKDDNISINNNKAIDPKKQYTIIFENPINNKKDSKSKITLMELLPHIDSSVFPSEDWLIDYFPKIDEPKDDKVYDRIAAELEDLMFNEKTKTDKIEQLTPTENKIDEFPTIMDILNDNINDVNKAEDQTNNDFKSNLESSDVEAMLLGKTNDTNSTLESTPMEVDTPDMNSLIANVDQLNVIPEAIAPLTVNSDQKEMIVDNIDNPHSPSILDETLQKGIEEHLPPEGHGLNRTVNEKTPTKDNSTATCVSTPETENSKDTKRINFFLPITGVEEVIFKKTVNGKCFKTVICPKNLKYSIMLEGKPVEFLGAPKYISSLEDLQVLLEIVNETELQNLYVLH